jgi:putative transposase
MHTNSLYVRHRFPAEIISHCVWLYYRFLLRYRDVEELMAERGVIVTYESIREWCQKFGGAYAKRLKHRATRSGDQWFLDEMVIKIQGKRQYLWRAVDQDGEVLDILVQSRRNKKAVKRFFRKLLKACCCVPRLITTDKLKSYAAAKEEIMPSVVHRQDKGLNNRAQNSHQPSRERERRMRGFKSAKHAQRFLAVFSVIGSFFRVGRHLLRAKNYRELMQRRLCHWRDVVNLPTAA